MVFSDSRNLFGWFLARHGLLARLFRRLMRPRRRGQEVAHDLLEFRVFRWVRLCHGSILSQGIGIVHDKAMQKARTAFAHAQRQLADLRASNDFPSIERHWLAFLDNANRVFTRLEQAANATPKGKNWWGIQVHEWKKDQLLRYVRQAKDSTHHSIQEIAATNPGRATPITDASPEEMAQVHEAAKKIGKPYAILGGFEVVFPHVEVLDVVNKGVTFPRPTLHLGQPVTATTPSAIGDLTLVHLEKMIRQVELFG